MNCLLRRDTSSVCQEVVCMFWMSGSECLFQDDIVIVAMLEHCGASSLPESGDSCQKGACHT